MPSFSLEDFTLPPDLPKLVPSELVRARPDILGAEALMHVANAEYGVAVSRLYPQLNLSADIGSQALTTGALFGSGSAAWSLVSQLTQPLFNPGLPAEKRAALAAFDAAAANYQAVVLESLRNVADVLRAVENDTERYAALSAADAASQNLLNSMEHRYALGAAGYYDLLIAQEHSQQTRLALIDAQARRLINSVSFYQAMGGGFFMGNAP
jgi:outer membrane protein TolC